MKHPFILLLLLLSILTWWSLQSVRQDAVDSQQLELNRQQKQLIEQARERQDIAALDAFIRDNPDSGWRDVAIFYRDEFAYRQAVAKGDQKSLEQYIRQYPESQWRNFAEQRLEQIKREEQARRDRQARQNKLAGKTLPLTGASATSPPMAEQPAARALTSPPESPSPDPRARVQRALSIYEQQREQKQFNEQQLQLRKQAEQERQRHCLQLRDQLKQFDSNIRWYELDAKGNRVFLDEQQLQAKRQETENYLKRHCR